MTLECKCGDGGIDNKCVHFGGAYGNPIPDPRCNCYDCDKARGGPDVHHVTFEEQRQRKLAQNRKVS